LGSLGFAELSVYPHLGNRVASMKGGDGMAGFVVSYFSHTFGAK
jgi:hypothetical protein